jgi:methyl-accepting chemotaxis protein
MAVKSIIDVDVNDDAFKAFMEMFAKYQAALKKLPGAWDTANKSINKSGSAIEEMTDIMSRQVDIIDKQTRAQEKMRREVEKTGYSLTDVARATTRIAGGMKDITLSLLKFSTLTSAFGLLSGGTGLFGFEALARSASQQRTRSMGLGITPGQLQAANITYERIGGAEPTLSSIADMQNDLRQRHRLQMLGISNEDIDNKNPFELLPQTLSAIRSRYLSIPENLRGTLAQSYGLTQFGLSMSQLRQLGGMSEQELAGLGTSLSRNATTIGGSNDINRRYQDFLEQLGVAGARLQTTLIDKLTPLAKPLGNVVDAFTNLAASALGSDTFRNGLKTFADWINDFASTLNTEETKSSIANFIEQVGTFATRMANAVRAVISFIEALQDAYAWVRGLLGGDAQEQMGPPNPYGGDDPNRRTPTPDNPLGTRRGVIPRYRLYEPMSYTSGDYNTFIDQMTRAESGGRDDARNLRSSASGRHQFIDETWLSVARRFGGSRIAGMSDEQILALRSDADFSRQMALSHTQFDIAPELLRSGVDPTNLALYAGWHFGGRGGAAVMQAGNDTPMSQILSAKAIAANPHLQNLTAGQWRNRYSGQFPGGGEGQPGRQVLSVQPGQAVHVVINDNTGGNIINTSASLGAPGYYG